MKMPKELFDALCDTIDREVFEKHGLKTLIDYRKNVPYVKDQFVAFCWAVFHRSSFDVKKLYDAGLYDSHIETALKRILSDFT